MLPNKESITLCTGVRQIVQWLLKRTMMSDIKTTSKNSGLHNATILSTFNSRSRITFFPACCTIYCFCCRVPVASRCENPTILTVRFSPVNLVTSRKADDFYSPNTCRRHLLKTCLTRHSISSL